MYRTLNGKIGNSHMSNHRNPRKWNRTLTAVTGGGHETVEGFDSEK